MERMFTDGPWVAAPKARDNSNGVGWRNVTAGDNGKLVCVVLDLDDPANAHLIASAPDLYEALDDLVTVMNVLSAIPGPKGLELRRKAEAALSKARGEVR